MKKARIVRHGDKPVSPSELDRIRTISEGMATVLAKNSCNINETITSIAILVAFVSDTLGVAEDDICSGIQWTVNANKKS